MCGICGLYGVEDSLAGLESRVQRMMDTIAHRGPDSSGRFVADGVGLGHRRLSIIDLSASGAQPMTLGATTVVYNGESYNFQQLRQELENSGRRFRGHSDTEVLLHAYDAWGLEGLTRLEGLFAFALWDGARKRLVLMRDRLGIKPLFYAWRGGQLAFGSEIKAVLAGIDPDRGLDDQALAEYLWYGNAFEDRTLYRAVRSLAPGHRIIIEQGVERIEAWWRIEEWLQSPAHFDNRQTAAAAVRDAVDAAVARQLVSDVPVAIFLSGGVDSSSIAAAAAMASEQQLASYAVGFDYQGGVQELPKARRVAAALGLDHHELHVRGGALDEVIVALVAAHDEPFADAANIPLYLLAQRLKGTVKVALQGDGGDEMFAGYRRYGILRHARFWRLWPQRLPGLLRALPGSAASRLARMVAAAGHPDPAMRMALLLTTATLQDPPTAMLTREARQVFEAATDPFLAFRRSAQRFAAADPVQRMLLTDISLQLPSQFLAKVDRATMAHGLEARVPLLDERVAALAVGLPVEFKVRGAQRKIALRDAMRGRLPAQTLDGPKTGFGVPYEHWLRGVLHAFARANILDRTFVDRFRLDRTRLVTALDEHRSGTRDRGFLLWKLLQLALWSGRFLS
ncbi:MAG TPA: asparagine synthase (glutamine-hydrolyzing) [Steroidobacteraceae bacterium]|jgi:asparagine synthase (glutamine-hydrolysing)|nr:asparagine synthase (glutamine-hydrolyzing) [Steroidobacteraceae bacterium]